MIAAEMQEEFLILYDKITNFDAPGYESDEISRFLSRAQERFVLHVYNPMGNKYLTGFEGTEKRRKDLSALVRNAELTSATLQAGSKSDGTFFELPTDFLYTIQEEADISSTDSCYSNSKGVEVKPITHDYYLKNKKNPYKKPYGELIWRLDFSNNGTAKRHELVTDAATTVSKYKVRYIKKPIPIITATGITIEGVTGISNCELSAITHRAIVDEAVAIAAGITNPETFQIRRGEAGLAE
tara:strand:+ start:3430 stop:4152 length:723 start_codon:yes stop_codon:yes gene_type:complete